MATTRQQPDWVRPVGGVDLGLHVRNSLHLPTQDTTVPFIPQVGRFVKWYSCGPTVYDLSHIGHARNYVGFDVIRRIMTDYFGYQVFQVMNITDIDDKIIKRANEAGEEFTELARRMEEEYMKDMKSLGVRPPDALTRVTEYVPEVIAYIETIIANGYGYESKGSVYFDVNAFEAKKNFYARLQPSQVGNSELLADGEGALSAFGATKRSEMDFALWKASKEGEPWWDSPWGKGRPGWHIECSAMASDLLGFPLDIHSGGVDLKFPHHDNELAQAEAYHNTAGKPWVNYFLHSGHLHIEKLKMSKSLKNFITIKEMLKKYSARQMRLLVLKHKYDEPMEYSDNEMQQMIVLDKKFSEFFHNVDATIRLSNLRTPAHWGPAEKDLSQRLIKAQEAVHAALSDDFHTPRVLDILISLIGDTNKYIADGNSLQSVLRSVSVFVTSIFKVFGLINNDDLGFATGAGDEEFVHGVLDEFATFRDAVRTIARNKALSVDDMRRELMTLSDSLRDDQLPKHGVRLEDGPEGKSVWKRDDPEALMLEVRQKREAIAKKAELKAQQQAAMEKARLEKAAIKAQREEAAAKKAAEKAEKAAKPAPQ